MGNWLQEEFTTIKVNKNTITTKILKLQKRAVNTADTCKYDGGKVATMLQTHVVEGECWIW